MSKQMSPKPIAKNPIAAHSMETQSKNPRKSRAKPAKRICYRNSINNQTPQPIRRTSGWQADLGTESMHPSHGKAPGRRVMVNWIVPKAPRNLNVSLIFNRSLTAGVMRGAVADSTQAAAFSRGRFRRRTLSLYYLTASVVRWFGVGDEDGFIRLASRLANSHPLQMIISLEIRASSSASIAWSKVTHSRENGRSLANSASLFSLIGFGSSVFARVRFVTGRLGSRPRPSHAK